MKQSPIILASNTLVCLWVNTKATCEGFFLQDNASSCESLEKHITCPEAVTLKIRLIAMHISGQLAVPDILKGVILAQAVNQAWMWGWASSLKSLLYCKHYISHIGAVGPCVIHMESRENKCWQAATLFNFHYFASNQQHLYQIKIMATFSNQSHGND